MSAPYYRKADGVIMCFDVCRPETLARIERYWMDEVPGRPPPRPSSRLGSAFLVCQVRGKAKEGTQRLLVGTKADLEPPERKLTAADGQAPHRLAWRSTSPHRRHTRHAVAARRARRATGCSTWRRAPRRARWCAHPSLSSTAHPSLLTISDASGRLRSNALHPLTPIRCDRRTRRACRGSQRHPTDGDWRQRLDLQAARLHSGADGREGCDELGWLR